MKRIATVGNFDGCHRGHRKVLSTLINEGAHRGLSPLVITFSNHPLDIIAPERAPRSLMTPDEKKERLEKIAGNCVMLEFTPELCRLTARQWLERMRDEYDVQAIVLGYDNTFGADGRQLSQDDYIALGRDTGIDIIIADAVAGCSSSLARKAVTDGDMTHAAEILGRYYRFPGRVAHGDRIGTSIGIPTANIDPTAQVIIPPAGVYAGYLRVPADKNSKEYRQAVINVGHRPTVDPNLSHSLRIEAHLPGWQGDIYDTDTEILFVKRLRDERRFDSLPLLKEQIDKDILAMREALDANPAVSVIMPVYNGAKFLHEAIHSLLAQTMPDWEAILVDDSSQDESWEILKNAAASDSRIHVFRKPNGEFAARGIAYALPHARGHFFQYMSQDDLLSADLFEAALDILDVDDSVDAVLPIMKSWARDSSLPEEGTPYSGFDISGCITGKEAFILSLNWQIHGFALIRMDIIRSLGFNTDYINSDEYETRREYLECRNICTSDGVFYYHTGNPEAVSRKWRSSMTGYIPCDAMLSRLAQEKGILTPEVRLEIARRLADDALRIYDTAKRAGAPRHDIRRIKVQIADTKNIWNIKGISRRMRLRLLTITIFFSILHANK